MIIILFINLDHIIMEFNIFGVLLNKLIDFVTYYDGVNSRF